tara:strand:- start:2342 stop:2800 length:459 start_codon:yes stop_codon:yes gene_type:complete
MDQVKQKRRWMPVVLTLSLALNLAVAAALAGAAWRHKEADRGPRVARGGAIYMQALPRDVRREIFRDLRAVMPARQDPVDMIAALRHVPFDPAAAEAVLASERGVAWMREDAASSAWLEYITALPDAEREVYANRLQELLAQRNARKSRKGD